MRNNTRIALIAVLALAPGAIAWTSITDGMLQLAPQSRLWVNGTSSVRDFQCTAALLEADVATNSANAVAGVAKGEKAISAVEVRVAANKLDCQNKTMNGHMLKALKESAHPEIIYKVATYDLTTTPDGVRATLNGTLTLGGVEKPIKVVATAKEEAGMLRVVGTQALLMSDFGLKPPTLMMGTLKVGNEVTIGFDLLLQN